MAVLATSHFLLFTYTEGLTDVNMSEISMDEIHQFFSQDPTIKLGGHWKPSDCLPRWKVSCRKGMLKTIMLYTILNTELVVCLNFSFEMFFIEAAGLIIQGFLKKYW